jgi:hypothetical protein
MAQGQTMQTSPAQEAGRPQPQTTVEASGGPFVRHSQAGRAPIYNLTNQNFAGITTQALVARPGYFRNFRVTHTVSGGTGAAATYPIDNPYNLLSLVQLKDAFGTPLIVAPGYETANLIPLYSGGFGLGNGSNLASNLPSYSAFTTAGNGSFSYALPLEFAKGYGVLSGANASLLPTLQFNYNTLGPAATAFYTAIPGGAPVIATQVDTDFYWLPEGVAVEPPGLGTTRQWILQQANPSIAANAAARLQLPRLGGYLDTIVAEVRDSTGIRNDTYWPSRLQLYVDGVPMIDSTMPEIYDDMWIQFGGVARPAGVIAISRKTSLNQQSLGLLDTGESYLSTNPGTLLELNFAPAGAGTNSPATVSVLVGQIVPTGAIIQGLPEV